MKAQENKVDLLRKQPCNKKCFDCGEKGPTYVVMKYGVFVCSQCSGIHREMSHTVKGVQMSIFKEEEITKLKEMGNDKA